MATTIHQLRGADHARSQKLERRLREQSTILRNRKALLRKGPPTEASGVMDLQEHSLDGEERGVGFSGLELTSQTVQRLETALYRLEAGRFGSCLDCRRRIGDARLRSLTFAALCLAGQERRDLGGGARASHSTAGWRHRVASARIRTNGH